MLSIILAAGALLIEINLTLLGKWQAVDDFADNTPWSRCTAKLPLRSKHAR
jgi:hypothetical protein